MNQTDTLQRPSSNLNDKLTVAKKMLWHLWKLSQEPSLR